VVSALSAGLALEELRRRPFDTILCDIRMPDMDGITFYQQLKNDPAISLTRFIMMTGDTSNARAEQFFKQQQLAVLRKPFTRQELLMIMSIVTPQ